MASAQLVFCCKHYLADIGESTQYARRQQSLESHDIGEQIPLLRRCTYLNTGSCSPRPIVVTAAELAAQRELDDTCLFLPDLAERTRLGFGETRARLSQLLGAAPDEMALTRSVSEGISLVAEVGTERIEQRVKQLTEPFRQALSRLPRVRVRSPAHRSLGSGILAINVEGMHGEEVTCHLWSRWRIVTRPTRRFVEGSRQGVRPSVAFFNTENELDQTVGALSSLVRA